MNSQLLDDAENNYCLSLFVDGDRAGVAIIDVSTGDFLCGEEDVDSLHHLVQGKRIRELVCRASPGLSGEKRVLEDLIRFFNYPFVNKLDDGEFTPESAIGAFAGQFGDEAEVVTSGLGERERIAAGALLSHCRRLRGASMPQVVSVDRLAGITFLSLDEETISNLELFEPMRGGSRQATLVNTIDKTLTPMGGRELRRWIQKPLATAAPAEERLEGVQEIYASSARFEEVARALKGIADIQRLAARIAARKAIPREFHALRESLEKLPSLFAALDGGESGYLKAAGRDLGDHTGLCDTIERAIVSDPPGHLRDGGVIAKGFDADLDGLIEASEEAKAWIAQLEARERERTGIPSLKVGYNKVFGYFIEVSNAHAGKVPQDYIAKQTLVSAQRYYTEALKEREQVILETEERRVELEQKVYERLCETVAGSTTALQSASAGVARIDAIQSMAAAARLYGYKRPVLDDGLVLDIVGGRHPVLERLVEEAFVPNDLTLDPDRKQFGLITGPNMSGKSTFLRQTALIVLMAQMGSFVPADRARIGVVDRIFTRVGASDRLSRGESTFLVEMNETANILRKMTDRSLVLLDEIGRGTSTFDGLSIAWAVTEFLLQDVVARPRTLFATHFHELTQLRNQYPRLFNLKITVKEWESGIIFLRKIVPGTSDKSFGLHAAKVAGLPPMVLKRAAEILESLEVRRALLQDGFDIRGDQDQYSLFSPPGAAGASAGPENSEGEPHPLDSEIRDFDLDNATPLEALLFVKRLKDRLKGEA
jgi:DNA mismatch repair protein MutS